MTSYEFRPSKLIPGDRDLAKNENDFLLDERFLEGIVIRSCSDNNVYFSNALLVKVGNEGVAPDKYKKIQNKLFFHAYAKICCRRELCSRLECKRNDAYAAEIVVEKLAQLEGGKLLDNEYISDVRVVKFPQFDNGEVNPRKGILYICKKTGYSEIACPIRLYDQTMGALIVGQIIEKKNYESWRKTIEELCEKNGYADYQIEALIGNRDDAKFNENVKSQLKSQQNVQTIITKVFEAVQGIEEELKEVYKNRQKQYSLEQSNTYIEKFRKELEERNLKNTDKTNLYPVMSCITDFENVGICIRNCVSDICKEIAMKTYALFLPDQNNLTNNNYSQLRFKKMSLQMKQLLKDNSTISSLRGEEYVKKYVDNIDSEYDYMIISQMEGYPIVLLLCLDECLKGISNEEERVLLIESINDIFSKIFSFAQMTGIEVKSEYFRAYLGSSMSIMRHELGQSQAGYQMLLEEFRTSVELYSKNIFEYNYSLGAEEYFDQFMVRCRKFIRDSEENLFITKIRMNSTKFLTGFMPMKKMLFYPYEEFLFKWHQIYDKVVKKNNLVFEVPHVFLNDLSRPRMNGDPVMIEQAVYNLTNNAMKYALQGTKVSLDCKLNNDKTKYEIIVKNIGSSFQSPGEVNIIFEYGKRGSNNEKEGSGLGLYLTRQIALGHGGDVECEMVELSIYNWSLIQLYIDFYEDKNVKNLCKDKVLYEELKKEWELNKDEIQRNFICEIPRTSFTPMYVHQNIRRGTTQFTFRFWIPYVE